MLTHFGKIIVYLIIGSNNLVGQLQIIFADGADAVVHHLAHNLQHSHKVIRQRHRILFNQLQGVLADIAAMVGNALHIAHQLQTAGNLAPVSCYRSLCQHQLQALLFDIYFAVVKIIIVADNLLRQGGILLLQVGDNLIQGILQIYAHHAHTVEQLLQLLVEFVTCHFIVPFSLHQPNLPVIYSSVLGLDGLANSCFVSLNSISSPKRKKAVLSEIRAACCILCVTITMV